MLYEPETKSKRLREKQRAISLLLSLIFIFLDEMGTAVAATWETLECRLIVIQERTMHYQRFGLFVLLFFFLIDCTLVGFMYFQDLSVFKATFSVMGLSHEQTLQFSPSHICFIKFAENPNIQSVASYKYFALFYVKSF